MKMSEHAAQALHSTMEGALPEHTQMGHSVDADYHPDMQSHLLTGPEAQKELANQMREYNNKNAELAAAPKAPDMELDEQKRRSMNSPAGPSPEFDGGAMG